MKLKKTLAGIAFLLLSPLPSYALTGNDLLAYCEKKNLEEMCSAYIGGATSGMLFFDTYLQTINKTKGKNLCVPDELIAIQMQKIVINFLRRNPEKLHLPATSLVLAAVVEKYSCR